MSVSVWTHGVPVDTYELSRSRLRRTAQDAALLAGFAVSAYMQIQVPPGVWSVFECDETAGCSPPVGCAQTSRKAF